MVGKEVPSKKYDLVKTSLYFQTSQFFRHSTLHGVRYIVEKGRPFVDKFLWLSCTSVGATVTLIIIVSLWEKFQTNPTITGLDTDFHNWDVPFPGITLCPESPYDNDTVNHLIATKYSHVKDKKALGDYIRAVASINFDRMQVLDNYTTYSDFPKENLKDLAIEVMTGCVFIHNCSWKGETVDCCDRFFPVFGENGLCWTFNVHPAQGVMDWRKERTAKPRNESSFKLQHIFETDLKWSISFFIDEIEDNPFTLYIHSSTQLPGMDVISQHIFDDRLKLVMFSDKTTYTTEDAMQLSIRQRHCVFPREIALLTDNVYSYGSCMRDCRIKLAYEKCKCIPYFYKEVKNFPFCNLDGMVCINQYYDKIMSKTVCNCELSCDNTVYEVEKFEDGSPDGIMEVAFVSWPMIRYKREVLFGWVDLLVSFGGIAGLFLGFSLLSGVEIIYYFTMRACCMVAREQETLEELKKEYELEEKPALDLSLTPYFLKKPENVPLTNPNPRIQKVNSFY